ncbi:hypothetical protein E2C01_008822 [Portunus trituberculatus]|uniref:Uncharacterized protein n=1 Tax=Portunus trituberculatus TaxID=210409 RepID=A0A5B7D3Y2_PORTR|nr:hypothetical protein [Portunus trituberculatus]
MLVVLKTSYNEGSDGKVQEDMAGLDVHNKELHKMGKYRDFSNYFLPTTSNNELEALYKGTVCQQCTWEHLVTLGGHITELKPATELDFLDIVLF